MRAPAETAAAQRANRLARGLTVGGRVPSRAPRPRRDHVAEVEAGLALGLDLDGIASDMDLQPKSVDKALRRKGRLDLIRALGIPDPRTAASNRSNR